jgi:ABC-type thiamin/hydroxymethylpyrimidine transport system permease subunit
MADTRRYFSTFELLLLATIAALIVAATVALKLPVKMPGHSGLVWMALLVVARCVVPKPGAAAAAGLLSGAVAIFLGVGDRGALNTLLSHAAAGLGVDAVLTLAGAGAWACAAAGLAGNLAKLGVKIALEVWIGIPTGFILLGRLYPTAIYIVFGLLGGLLGFLVVQALRRAGYFAFLAEKR